MNKVLIADDEAWIRKGIYSMILWKELDLELVAEAEDGQEALDKARQLKPDIVISDVRMPSLDGLMLAEQLMAQNPLIKIIIVSGYDDFEYAQRAIHANAMSYLLKPVDKEQLNRILEKAIRELKEEQYQQSLKGKLFDIVEKLLADCVVRNDSYAYAELQDLLKYEVQNALEYRIAILQLAGTNPDKSRIKRSICQACIELKETGFRCFPFTTDDARLGLWIWRMDRSRDLEWFLRHTGSYLHERFHVSCQFGYSGAYRTVEHLPEAYNEAKLILEEKSIHDQQSVIAYEQYAHGRQTGHAQFFSDYLDDVMNGIKLDDLQMITNVLNRLQEALKDQPAISIAQVRNFFFTIAAEVMKMLAQQADTECETLAREGMLFCNRIHQYHGFVELIENMSPFLQNSLHLINQRKNSNIIQQAMNYIKLHYDEAIRLQFLSEKFHLNPSYFSTLFKEYSGESFIDYLTKVRISKAKELLEQSDFKVKQISFMVGYEDNRYFSKLFKKHVGKMPSDYRGKDDV